MTNRNYVTIFNTYIERGNERGVVRIRKYNNGLFTLYAKKYTVGVRDVTHRSCNKFYDCGAAIAWANAFVEAAVSKGARVVAD